jgi:amino acid transporter
MKDSKVFARAASGLVRQVSTWDAFVLNVSTMTFFWAATWYGWAQFLSPGSDVIWGLAIGGVLVAFNAVNMGLFANIYPRSGGDYVYNSRVLHPIIGYAENFSMWWWDVFWTGMSAFWAGIYGFSTLFLNLGVIMNNDSLVSLGSALYITPWSVLVATIIIAVVCILGLSTTKIFFRSMAAVFIIGIIGIVLLIAILVSFDQSAFIPAFNSFMKQYAPDIPDYYHYVIDTARGLGWNYPSPDPNLLSSANQVAIVATVPVVGFGFWSCYMAGEIKGAQRIRTHVLSMLGSQVAMVVGMIVIGLLAFRAFGYEFLGSTEYLFYMAPSKMAVPVAPETQFFAMLLYPNPIIGFIIGLGLSLLCATYTFSAVIMSGRVLLAYSVDRVIPEAFSKVSQKTRAPWVAIVFTWIGAEICMILLAYAPQIFGAFGYATAFCFGGTLGPAVTGLSAILVPYLKKTKEHYNSSPVARLKVAGIPLIAITGVVSFLYMGWATWSMLTLPAFGINPAFAGPLPMTAGCIVLVASVVIFLASKYYRKTKGVPIDLAFKEIPPE